LTASRMRLHTAFAYRGPTGFAPLYMSVGGEP